MNSSAAKQNDKWWDKMKEAIKQAYGTKPTAVDGLNTVRTNYYEWVLLNKIKGLVEVTAPETWDIDYLLDELFLRGKFCITDTQCGVLPLACQPFGINYANRPTDVNIANPVLGSFERKIDANCVVIYLYDNIIYRSLAETIHIFAQRLASCDSSIDVNLINSKVAYIVECADKKQADEAKLLIDKITLGEPAVFYHETSGMNLADRMQLMRNDVKNTYIADLVQKEKRAIYNEFLTQIGVNNAAEEKKERLLVDEVNSNNDELQINLNYAYGNLKKQIKKANAMFPNINFDIKLPYFDRMKKASEQANDSFGFNGNMGDKKQQRQSNGDVDNNN